MGAGTLDPDRWQEIKTLLASAFELPAAERSSFLRQRCENRSTLRRELASLLAAFEDDSFLEFSAFERQATRLLPGDRLGPFRIERFLGRGGMGEVYLAQQETPLRRTVALKVMHSTLRDRPQAMARFQAEGQALALMEHPYIARVYATGTDAQGRLYAAMEAIDGEPITAYARCRRLTVDQRLALLREVCGGVQHAHQRGVLHRDLKPQNVLVTETEDEAIPKIIDFGVAKIFDNPLSDPAYETEHGQLLGTPRYMSPEQAQRDPKKIDTRSDVYALGLLLYELLVGRLPCASPTPDSQLPPPSTRWQEVAIEEQRQLATERRTSPIALAHRLHGDLDLLVMKALEHDPEKRYASPAELGADIERLLTGRPLLARGPDPLYRVGKLIRRRRALAAAVAVCLLAIGLGAAGLGLGFKRAVASELVAEERARQAVAASLVARRETAVAKETSRFLRHLFQAKNASLGPYGPETTLVDILARGAASMDQLDHLPQVQIRLLSDLAGSLSGLGEYRRARILNEAALTRQLEFNGFDHWATPYLLRQNGMLSTYLGEFEHGRKMTERAIAFWQRTGEAPRDLASARLNLAVNLRERGEPHGALPLLQSALTGAEEVDEPRLAALIHISLGSAWFQAGDPETATLHLDRAEEIYRRSLGGKLLDLTGVWSIRARIELHRGKLPEARALFEQVLAIERSDLSAEHPYVADSLLHLARIDRLQGWSASALERAEEARGLLVAELGEDHYQIAEADMELAAIHHVAGRAAAAEELYRRALRTLEKQVGPEAGLLVRPLEQLSEILRLVGREAEAADLALRADAIRRGRAILGATHQRR